MTMPMVALCVWAALTIGVVTGRLAEGSDKGFTLVLTALLWPLGSLILIGALLAKLADSLRLPHVLQHRYDAVMVGPAMSRRISLKWTMSFGRSGKFGLMIYRFGDRVPRNMSGTRHLDEALSCHTKPSEGEA